MPISRKPPGRGHNNGPASGCPAKGIPASGIPANGRGWGGPARGAGSGGQARPFTSCSPTRRTIREARENLVVLAANRARREVKRERFERIEDALYEIALAPASPVMTKYGQQPPTAIAFQNSARRLLR